MIFHPEEYEKAKDYWKERSFPGIRPEQYSAITEEGKDLLRFHLAHPALHHLISLSVFLLLFGLDAWALLYLGRLFPTDLSRGLMIGLTHGVLMYQLAIYTLHEGAAHKLIVLRRGSLSRFFSMVVNNLNRVSLSETDYYARNHLSHHAHFTTSQDDEFLNFVSSPRLLAAFLPYASVFNFTDFKAHSDVKYTPSRMLAFFLTILYNGGFALLMHQYYSWTVIFISLALVFPNLAFWLDRLRQYTEHNLMPLNVLDGTRDLGTGFWGMLIGGGPWGQPCHWSHHLYPGLPWYNQLRLHFFVKKVLIPEQRREFLLKPVIGYPLKLLQIIKITSKDKSKLASIN
jgi:hypothetical protein